MQNREESALADVYMHNQNWSFDPKAWFVDEQF